MKIILREFVLSFHDLWQPKSIAGGEPKYSATLIARPDSSFKYDGKINPAKAIAAAVKKVREEKWPDLNEVAAKKIKVWCWNKADGSTTREQYVDKEGNYWAGMDGNAWYFSAAKRADQAPDGITVLDQKRRPLTKAQGLLYSGCVVNAVVDIYANERQDGRTLNASLEGIQLVRKGEPLGFKPIVAAEEFDDEEIEDDEFDAGDEVDGDDL